MRFFPGYHPNMIGFQRRVAQQEEQLQSVKFYLTYVKSSPNFVKSRHFNFLNFIPGHLPEKMKGSKSRRPYETVTFSKTFEWISYGVKIISSKTLTIRLIPRHLFKKMQGF